MRSIRASSGLLLVAILLAACGPGRSLANGAATEGRPRVVATFSVIGDLASRVGGDDIELTVLVRPGQDTHTFTPSPADAAALAEARLVLENGLGFETWLDDLYRAAGSRAARAVLTEGLKIVHGDPHVWHSVPHTIGMVARIRDALALADPPNAADYQARAEAYTAELEALDAWIIEQVELLPAERRRLVTTHDTFGYFARRYGFEVLGTLLPTTTEGASPSAQELAALAEAVREAGVPAVFAENVTSNDLLAQVAAEAGVEVVGALYTDALGPPGSGGETYAGMMRHNVTTIVEVLQG